MDYQIRRAEPADAPGIVAVARETWHATYEGIIPREIQDRALREWYDVDRIAQQAANQRGALFAAADADGRVVAFAHLARRREPGDAELMRIYALPQCQGRGLGRQLIQAGLAALQTESPVERLFVQVERENQIGRRAYTGLGFTFVREYEENLFGHPSTMVEMCLQLP